MTEILLKEKKIEDTEGVIRTHNS